ncbi:MAG: hypothetical protein JWM93_2469 [Frankiales bacterium]|nr:hypothetical protein [Frankiales bacterium]
MSAVETLVIAIAKARPDWHRDEIREAIAAAVASPLHRLTLEPAARPAQLHDSIRRHVAARHDPGAPPPVREVLDDADFDPERVLAGVALARQTLAAAKEKP